MSTDPNDDILNPGDVIDLAEDALNEGNNEGNNGSRGPSGPAPPNLDPYRGILFRFRINPVAFRHIIGVAAAEHWTADEFMWAVSSDAAFQRMFPGINALFQQGMSFGQAITTWRKMAEEYRGVAKALGLGHLARLTPRRVGWLIRRGVDVEEFALRLSILDIAKKSEPFRDTFNRILSDYGQEKLDRQGWFKFLMGHADKRIYDLYETVSLYQQLGEEGLNLREARKIARAVGPAGAPADLSEVLAQVGHIKDALGTQLLTDAGFEAKDLAFAVLRDQLTSPERKRKADRLLNELEQMVRNRQAGALDNQATFIEGDRPISAAAPQGELAG